MKINRKCICMVDTCWRHGICQFCANNHGNKMETLSCRISPDEFSRRKERWEKLHDEPIIPMDSSVGITGKYTQETVREAVLSLTKCREIMETMNQSVNGTAFTEDLISAAKSMFSTLKLAVQQTHAAVHLSESVLNAVHRH